VATCLSGDGGRNMKLGGPATTFGLTSRALRRLQFSGEGGMLPAVNKLWDAPRHAGDGVSWENPTGGRLWPAGFGPQR